VVVGILLSIYNQFQAKSVGERILKIGQYLAKLEAKIEWHFFRTRCISEANIAFLFRLS